MSFKRLKVKDMNMHSQFQQITTIVIIKKELNTIKIHYFYQKNYNLLQKKHIYKSQ